MVFNAFYNWFKFNVLPPSVLFNNSLFLERDSNARRVTNNLGLTFRNSKWTSFSRSDLSQPLNPLFNNLIIITFVLVLVALFTFNGVFYNSSIVTNDIAYYYWALNDNSSYYLFSFYTAYSTALTLLLENTYSTISGWLFVSTEVTVSNNTSTTLPNWQSSTSNYLYYHILNNSNNNLPLEDGYSQDFLPLNKLETNGDFLNTLYSLTTNLTYLNNSTATPNTVDVTSTHFDLSNTMQPISSPNPLTSTLFLASHFSWSNNLSLPASSLSSVNSNVKQGSFYLTALPLPLYNNNLTHFAYNFAMSVSVNNQISAVNTERFLYNYSILHSQTFKHAHTLTMANSLFSLGFYDTTFVTNNIWASDLFSNSSAPQYLLSNQFSSMYPNSVGSYFNQSSLDVSANLNLQSNLLNKFSYFEESFLWFTKRFYVLNNLESNINNISHCQVPNDLTPWDEGLKIRTVNTTNTLNSNALLNGVFYTSTNDSFITNLPQLGLISNSPSTNSLLNVNSEEDLIVNAAENLLINLLSSPLETSERGASRYAFFSHPYVSPINQLKPLNANDQYRPLPGFLFYYDLQQTNLTKDLYNTLCTNVYFNNLD